MPSFRQICLFLLCALSLGYGPIAAGQEPPAPLPEASGPAESPAVPERIQPDPAPWNKLVLEAVREIPSKGVYQANAAAIDNLGAAIKIQNGGLVVDASLSRPSFCSTATYLVFVKVIDRWSRSQNITLPPAILESLLVNRQPDGTGVWGCWNANGPGTARLFHLLGIGRNFTSLDQALPGDFMKVFWNENIGSLERGHSVVYLGRDKDASGGEYLTYWSSNQPDGYGVARIPLGRAKRVLFSRLGSLSALLDEKTVDLKDRYLAEMLKRPGSEAEMLKMTGATPSPGGR